MKLRIQGLKLRDYGYFVLRLVFLLLLLADRMDEGNALGCKWVVGSPAFTFDPAGDPATKALAAL